MKQTAAGGEQRLTPGSTNYYLARFTPPAQRADVSVVLALGETLERIRRLSEPQVALAKLTWWRAEIARAPQRGSSHPLANAVGRVLSGRRLGADQLIAITDALEHHLLHPGYRQPEEVAAHHQACSGGLADFIDRLFRPADSQAATACGAYFGAVNTLRRLGAEATLIRPLIADSLLQAHGLHSARELRTASPGLVAALCDQAAALKPADSRGLSPPLLAMQALADASLGEIRRSGAEVLASEIDLTPLRKLWIAWRSR